MSENRVNDVELVLLTVETGEAVCGKNTSMRRIAASLEEAGVRTRLESVGEHAPEEILARAHGGGVRGVHSFHAYKAGRAGRELAAALRVPHVVTMSGTDVHLDLMDPTRRGAVLSVLSTAAGVVVSNDGARERLLEAGVEGARIHLVPKGVPLPANGLGEIPELAADDFVFLLPGGWRPVKNNLFPLEPLAALAAEDSRVRLVYLGPVLDAGYRRGFEAVRARYPFARDAGVLPHERMAAAYRRADVVLNVSHDEGGANAVLEAMAAGRAVLASDIPGNRGFLPFDSADWNRSAGVLYATTGSTNTLSRAHSAEDFLAKARRLLQEPDTRRTLGTNARRRVIERHSPEHERAALLDVYRAAGVLGLPADPGA
ncbi:MAG: glycosyltransferase family 4 protein [Planctomycetes bacterium]|nr:glycosyltransferase family 4 protein [Planctomycetota bacterium]